MDTHCYTECSQCNMDTMYRIYLTISGEPLARHLPGKIYLGLVCRRVGMPMSQDSPRMLCRPRSWTWLRLSAALPSHLACYYPCWGRLPGPRPQPEAPSALLKTAHTRHHPCTEASGKHVKVPQPLLMALHRLHRPLPFLQALFPLCAESHWISLLGPTALRVIDTPYYVPQTHQALRCCACWQDTQ